MEFIKNNKVKIYYILIFLVIISGFFLGNKTEEVKEGFKVYENNQKENKVIKTLGDKQIIKKTGKITSVKL